jgi:membrane associated rhomboid family serine protease
MYSSGVRIIIWMCAIFYLLQHLYFPITHELFGMAYLGHPNFNTIQFLTYGFLHGDTMHIFVNMLMLAIFGTKIENEFGTRNLFVLFVITIICGGIAQQANQMILINSAFGTYFPLPPSNFFEQVKLSTEYGREALTTFNRITIGASAGVFGIMLAYTTLFPKQRLGLPWFKTTMSARLIIGIYVIGEIYMLLYDPQPNVAHFAHLAGGLGGFLLAKLWMKSKLDENNA